MLLLPVCCYPNAICGPVSAQHGFIWCTVSYEATQYINHISYSLRILHDALYAEKFDTDNTGTYIQKIWVLLLVPSMHGSRY